MPALLAAASVTAQVDKDEVYKGDTVTLKIEAEGDHVEFPVIREIGGYPILGTGQSSNIQIINGSVSKKMAKTYTFAPMQDVNIPSFIVKIDGKSYRTEPMHVHIVQKPKPSPARANGMSMLEISVDKHKVHVGEPVQLTLTLRYRSDAGFVQANLQKMEFPDFWTKQMGRTQRYQNGIYTVEKRRFLLFPQKPGHYDLGPVTAKLARRVRTKAPIDDPFFNDDFFNNFFARLEWTRIASNAVSIDVDPLPGGVNLYGDFAIEAHAGKREVHAGKPVTVTVTVKGKGNIEDIEKFTPEIPNAVVYAEEPEIEELVENGTYGGTFTQKITVVADADYTIPPFTIRYFDAKAQKVVEKKTAPIPIRVIGGHPKSKPSTADTVTPTDRTAKESGPTADTTHYQSTEATHTPHSFGFWPLALAYLLGLFSGIGLWRWWRKEPFKKGSEPTVVRKILKAGNDRELYDLLLPYAADDTEIAKALKKLEENIRKGTKHQVDKRILAGIVEEIEGA